MERRISLARRLVSWAGCGCLALSLQAATEDDPKVIQAAQRQLDAEIQPVGSLMFNALRDDNDIEVVQGGVQAAFWPDPGWPMRIQALWGDISQDSGVSRGSNDFNRTALHLYLDEYRLAPEAWLAGRLTGEFFDDDELVGGRVSAHYQWEDRSTVSAQAESESFWTIHDVRDPRQYPRVNNLALIEPDARINRVRGAFEWVPVAEQQVRLQAGLADYEDDDNEQVFAYAHYQLPILDSEVGKWTVLRPNLYYEHFADSTAAYYSPDVFVSVGLAAHTIRQDPVNRLEFEINPVLLFEHGEVTTDSEPVEMGLHLVLDYTRQLGNRWAVGAAGFVYGETTDYWLWRTTAQCSYKF